jgi:hypothetical protein
MSPSATTWSAKPPVRGPPSCDRFRGCVTGDKGPDKSSSVHDASDRVKLT